MVPTSTQTQPDATDASRAPDTSHASSAPETAAPPRLARGWVLVVALVAIVALVALGVTLANPIRAAAARVAALAGEHEHEHAEDDGWWTCGMHPWVIQSSPEGGCPICKMDLVPLDPTKFAGELAIDPTVVQNMGVRLGEVTAGPLHREVRTVGTVVVDETAMRDVNTRFSGWIEELNIDETGEQVDEGEVLFRVYSPELYAAVDEYRLARQGLEQVNPSAADVQRELVRAAEQRLRLMGLTEEQIARLSAEDDADEAGTVAIYSPFTGTVLEKTATEGMRIEPGMRMYRIADLSRLWVEAAVYEDQLPLIREGQPATMALSYLPGKTFQGEVTFISPTVDPQTRQGRVRLEFANEQGEGGWLLRPGMFAEVTLEHTVDEEATLVAREAIIDTGRRQVALVSLGEGRFEPRELTLGLSAADGMVQVTEGLAPGEKVVTSGQFLLDSEARVREALAKMLKADEQSTEPAAVETAHTQTAALPAEVAGPLNDVLRPYLRISDTLSRDSTEHVAHLAADLATAAERLAPHAASLDSAALAGAAEQLKAAGDDLAAAREAFNKVSEQIVPVLRQTGVPATLETEVQALRCPMFPPGEQALWLQVAGEPRNPYYGSSMLACFDERIALPQTPVEQE